MRTVWCNISVSAPRRMTSIYDDNIHADIYMQSFVSTEADIIIQQGVAGLPQLMCKFSETITDAQRCSALLCSLLGLISHCNTELFASNGSRKYSQGSVRPRMDVLYVVHVC